MTFDEWWESKNGKCPEVIGFNTAKQAGAWITKRKTAEAAWTAAQAERQQEMRKMLDALSDQIKAEPNLVGASLPLEKVARLGALTEREATLRMIAAFHPPQQSPSETPKGGATDAH